MTSMENNTLNTPKTIAYIRVSTTDQNTQVQKTELLDYAQRHKFMIDEFITIEISSRKSQELRKIDQLKEQLNFNDTVICTELSRLARSMIEVLNLIQYFKENSISVIFTKQPELSTNKDSALQSLLFSIYGYFAETERELISERVKGGIANARKMGKQIGRKKGSTGRSIWDTQKDKIMELHSLGVTNKRIHEYVNIGTEAGLGKYIKKLNKLQKLEST